jgi:transcriptional regulator with XRE-family HTH domain
MSAEERQRPGSTLIRWLLYAANERGMSLRDLADNLGVTYGYISQLRTGIRQVSGISDEFSSACARFLGVPRIAVLLAAGRVHPEDYYHSPEEVRELVRRGVSALMRDPEIGPLVPANLEVADYEMQRLVVLLYERATGKKLLPEAVDLEALLREIEEDEAT